MCFSCRQQKKPSRSFYIFANLTAVCPGGSAGVGGAKIGNQASRRSPYIDRLAGYDYEISCQRAHQELGWFPKDEYESALEAALATV